MAQLVNTSGVTIFDGDLVGGGLQPWAFSDAAPTIRQNAILGTVNSQTYYKLTADPESEGAYIFEARGHYEVGDDNAATPGADIGLDLMLIPTAVLGGPWQGSNPQVFGAAIVGNLGGDPATQAVWLDGSVIGSAGNLGDTVTLPAGAVIDVSVIGRIQPD